MTSLFLPIPLRTVSTISQLAPLLVTELKSAFPDVGAIKNKPDLVRLIAVEVETRMQSTRASLEIAERATLVRKIYQGLYPNTPVPELDLIEQFASFLYTENLIHTRGRWARLLSAIGGFFR